MLWFPGGRCVARLRKEKLLDVAPLLFRECSLLLLELVVDLELLLRFVVLAGAIVENAEAVVGVGERRRTLNGAGVIADGLLIVVPRIRQDPELQVSFAVLRVDRDRVLKQRLHAAR